jgi:PAS domain S-box-containing protein
LSGEDARRKIGRLHFKYNVAAVPSTAERRCENSRRRCMPRTATLSADALVASLRTIADHSFDSIMITRAGKGSPILYVNKAFTALTGYSAKRVIGKSPKLLQGPATERAPLDALRRCMEKGKVFEGHVINYDSKKRPFVMHWRVVPVKQAKGRPAEYYIAIQRTGNPG